MAALKIVNQKGKYRDSDAKKDLLHYIMNPCKSNYQGGSHVDLKNPAESMMQVSDYYGKASGVQLRHYILSFSQTELRDPRIADQIAQRIIQYFGKVYQIVFAVHENTEHLHVHFVMNSVSFVDGRRHYGTHAEFYQEMEAIRKVLRRYGICELHYVSVYRKPDDAVYEF